MVVSNIGVVNDFSSLYTTTPAIYTATIQVALNDDHAVSSFDYMDARAGRPSPAQFPDVRTFFQSGSMVDAVLNSGMPAPIDIQVSSSNLKRNFAMAQDLATRIRTIRGVGEVYIPQDMNYPGIRLDVDRVHAGELGLTQKEVVDNVITALNSNYMIAPNYWVDDKSGNDYYLTVQYYEHGRARHSRHAGSAQHSPARAQRDAPTTLDTVVKLTPHPDSDRDRPSPDPARDGCLCDSLRRGPGRTSRAVFRRSWRRSRCPENVRVDLHGMVEGMQASFKSFGFGFMLSFLLLYLILVAQFRSFVDPVLIMLAIPMGFMGVLIILPLTHTTLNVMSLMGVLMLVGIADSNSILIVDFAHKLEEQGLPVTDAIITACRVRLRPILMTSLATIIGMTPMALKLGTGAEQYTPMARAIIGGLTSSVLLTVFIVPAAYLLVYGKRRRAAEQPEA